MGRDAGATVGRRAASVGPSTPSGRGTWSHEWRVIRAGSRSRLDRGARRRTEPSRPTTRRVDRRTTRFAPRQRRRCLGHPGHRPTGCSPLGRSAPQRIGRRSTGRHCHPGRRPRGRRVGCSLASQTPTVRRPAPPARVACARPGSSRVGTRRTKRRPYNPRPTGRRSGRSRRATLCRAVPAASAASGGPIARSHQTFPPGSEAGWREAHALHPPRRSGARRPPAEGSARSANGGAARQAREQPSPSSRRPGSAAAGRNAARRGRIRRRRTLRPRTQPSPGRRCRRSGRPWPRDR
jgi:hypothetical protein